MVAQITQPVTAPAFAGIMLPERAVEKLNVLRRENAALTHLKNEVKPRKTFFGSALEMAELENWQREIVLEMQEFIDGLNLVCRQGDHVPTEGEFELKRQIQMAWAHRVALEKWLPALRREGFRLTESESPEIEMADGSLEFEKLRWSTLIQESCEGQWREFYIEIRRIRK